MIDIGKFAKPINKLVESGKKTFLRFGANSRENIAAELHRFADKVGAGDILVQNIQAGQVASIDNYFTQALFIEFVEQEDILESLADARAEAVAKLNEIGLQPGQNLTIRVPTVWTAAQIAMFHECITTLLEGTNCRIFVTPSDEPTRVGFE